MQWKQHRQKPPSLSLKISGICKADGCAFLGTMSCQKSRFQKIIDWLTSIEALWQIENTDRHAHQVAVDVI